MKKAERTVFPEDVRFQGATGRLFEAGESIGGRPLDFGRRGGAAFLGAGDLQANLLSAKNQAMAGLSAARAQRDLQAAKAARVRRAAIEGAKSGAAADLGTAAFGAFADFIAKKKPWELGFGDAPAATTPTATTPSTVTPPAVTPPSIAPEKPLIPLESVTPAPVSAESPVVRNQGDPWVYKKVGGTWMTMDTRGDGTWLRYPTHLPTDRLEATLLGGGR